MLTLCAFLSCFFFCLYFSSLFSQLLPAMSRKSKPGMSRDELEIQAVLSPTGSQSTVSTPAPGQQPRDVAPSEQLPQLATLSKECMMDFATVVAQSVALAIQGSGLGPDDSPPHEEFDSSSDEEDGDGVDDELPTGPPFMAQHGDSLPLFRVGVNEDISLQGVHDVAKTVAIVHTSPPPGADVSHAPGSSSNATAQNKAALATAATNTCVITVSEVEPDKNLPLPDSRAPTNWWPHPSVLAWAKVVIDSCEWTEADREALTKEFSPEKEYDHLFQAVPAPADLLAAEKHSVTREQDYLFRRYDTENHLYNANADLACGFRPLLEVLSDLRDKPGMERNRTLLARVFQSMASSVSQLSRGRRELGRRFVPLTNATALFKTKPSHYCLFGEASIEKAVETAVSVSKVNKDLVLMPKKRTQPFHSSYPGGKYSAKGKSQPYRQQSYYASSYKGKFQSGQKGRTRGGRKGKGQRQQAKTSTQE